MKFFFADNLDAVDPDFDFENDETKPDRDRQGRDLFAHEVLEENPYDGILISRSILEPFSSVRTPRPCPS